MAEKLKQTIDFKEIPQFGLPFWLAGFLEIGSGVFFERRKTGTHGREAPYAFPVMSFSDHELKRLEIMQKIIGGRLKPIKHSRSIHLLVEGDQASWLAYSIRPYAPSRTTIIDAFLEWSAATMTEDRVALAQQYRGRRIINSTAVYNYTNLVTTPQFVRGVIDGRGNVGYRETSGKAEVTWIHPVVNFLSINGPLLEAMHSTYGGNFHIVHRAGDTVVIRGEPVVLKNNSAQWTIGTGLMKELIAWANPLLPLSNSLEI